MRLITNRIARAMLLFTTLIAPAIAASHSPVTITGAEDEPPKHELPAGCPALTCLIGLTEAQIADVLVENELPQRMLIPQRTVHDMEVKGTPCSNHYARIKRNLRNRARAICGGQARNFSYRTNQKKFGNTTYYCSVRLFFDC